jgi:hypothetical protein
LRNANVDIGVTKLGSALEGDGSARKAPKKKRTRDDSDMSSDDDAADDDADSDKDDSDDDERPVHSAKELYLPPLEVREQMKKLWEHEAELVKLVWAPQIKVKESINTFTSGTRIEVSVGFCIVFIL